MAELLARVSVDADRAYDVAVGRGLLDQVPGMVATAQRVAVIAAASRSDLRASVERELQAAGFDVTRIEIPEGEQAKTAETAAACWAALGTAGFTRSDAIVAVGGGATTDLAGFVAATWLRGIAVVHVPTTVLGMVDAAVGGKTGINTTAGKNLVGSFWSPAGVVCDIDTLATLPPADLRAGFAEVVKCGFIADVSILDEVQRDPAAAIDPAGDLLPDLVRRSIQVKADVVSADFTETSSAAGGAIGREALNYGHTLGHAIENLEQYSWRHGDAIAVGMVFAAELAARGGRLGGSDVERHREILASLALPVSYDAGRWDALSAVMALDKKARGSMLRMVVLDGIGTPVIWAGPDPDSLAGAYDAISS